MSVADWYLIANISKSDYIVSTLHSAQDTRTQKNTNQNGNNNASSAGDNVLRNVNSTFNVTNSQSNAMPNNSTINLFGYVNIHCCILLKHLNNNIDCYI